MNDKTGGPAFPVADPNKLDLPTLDEYYRAASGMTLRDYFAAKANIGHEIEDDGCIGQRLALALMDGAMPPSWDNDYLEARIWWARAESRLRYMYADAMLLERVK